MMARPTAGIYLPLSLRRVRSSCVAAACFWLLANLLPVSAKAGSFSVDPVRIELSPSAPTAVIHVQNTGSAPVTVQLSPMAWSQPDGKDRLLPTRELLATPQIFSLKPGATQLVRVGVLKKTDPGIELPYRLLLEEIPPPPPPDFKGLQVALNISMPVFLQPQASVAPSIRARLVEQPDQGLLLHLSNDGKKAARLHDISLHYADQPAQSVISHASGVYVLPGQERRLELGKSALDPGRKLLLKSASQTGSTQIDVDR